MTNMLVSRITTIYHMSSILVAVSSLHGTFVTLSHLHRISFKSLVTDHKLSCCFSTRIRKLNTSTTFIHLFQSKFETAISQLIHHPEYNSTLILRSDLIREDTSSFPEHIP